MIEKKQTKKENIAKGEDFVRWRGRQGRSRGQASGAVTQHISAHVLDCGEHKEEQCTFSCMSTLVLLFFPPNKAQTHISLTSVAGAGKQNSSPLHTHRKGGRDVPRLCSTHLAIKCHSGISNKTRWGHNFFTQRPERTNEGDGARLCMASFSGSLSHNTWLLWSRSSRRTQAPCSRSRGLILPMSLSFSLSFQMLSMYIKQGRNIFGQLRHILDI